VRDPRSFTVGPQQRADQQHGRAGGADDGRQDGADGEEPSVDERGRPQVTVQDDASVTT